MFKLNRSKQYKGDAHRIVHDKLVLDSDGMFDLLYVGRNAHEQHVVTTLLDDDLVKGKGMYASVITSSSMYGEFLRGKLPLLRLLETGAFLFITEATISGEEKIVVQAEISDIPESHRPRAHAMAPEIQGVRTLGFATRAYGAAADKHVMEEKVFKRLSGTMFGALKAPAQTIVAPFYPKDAAMQHSYDAMASGSFKIGFLLEMTAPESNEISPRQVNMFTEDSNPEEAVGSLIEYVLNDLKSETGIDQESEPFLKIKSAVQGIYESRHMTVPETLADDLVGVVKSTVIALSEVETGEHFTGLEILNTFSDGNVKTEVPIGRIDEEYLDEIRPLAAAYKLESAPNIKTDPFEVPYTFHVYDFNKISGNGWAYVQEADEDGSLIAYPIIIHARGLKNYQASELSGSLDRGTIIKFPGVATRHDGRIKLITFNLKQSGK